MSASPDGLTEDGQCIVKVKCSATLKTFHKYIKENGFLAAKHLGQVQMLLHITCKKQAYFCVAHLDYELCENC